MSLILKNEKSDTDAHLEIKPQASEGATHHAQQRALWLSSSSLTRDRKRIHRGGETGEGLADFANRLGLCWEIHQDFNTYPLS